MKWWSLCIGIVLTITACTTSPVTPTRASRQIIDSLYTRRIIVYQSQIDSICAAQHELLFQVAVDSIMSSRKMEMNILVK